MHSLSPCYGLLTALVVLNSVARWCNTTQVFTQMVSFYMLVCMGFGRNFSMGALVEFSKCFSTGGGGGGAKVEKLVFYHSKLRKPFFAEIFEFLPLFRHPYACVQEKFVPHH